MAGKRKIGSGRISTSEGKRGYGKGTKIRNWGTDGLFFIPYILFWDIWNEESSVFFYLEKIIHRHKMLYII